jgi:tetratricopeptide (TPR) repeat protein
MTVRGAAAAMLKNVAAQGDAEQQEQVVQGLIGLSGAETSLVSHSIAYDDTEAAARVEARGIAYSNWSRENERLGYGLDQITSSLEFTADRARPAWRAIPVASGAPSHKSLTMRIKLPGTGEGFALDGGAALDDAAGPMRVARKAVLANGWATAESRLVETGAEIAAPDIAEARKRIGQWKARQLRLLAPAAPLGRVEEVEAARRAKKLQPLIALFDARVAAKPKEAQSYVDRAWLHEQLFDVPKTLADLNRAIAIEPSADRLLDRASAHFTLGNIKGAVADAQEALSLDAESSRALLSLASYQGAIALLDERIALGGKESGSFATAKAEIQGQSGEVEAALATIDEAVAKKPGDAGLLNERCWLKGTLNVALETGLKDCTRAIELAGNPAGALDSRAMIYFRMNRMEEARADLDAALALAPDQAASLFLRGVLRKRAGEAAAGAADVKTAATLAPHILKEYQRYGITP